MKVRNPRNGEFDFEFEPPDPEQLAAATQRLRAAQGAWSSLPVVQRIETVRRWQLALEAAREPIVAALTVDTGRHLIAQAEFAAVLSAMDRWSRLAPTLLHEDEGRSTDQPTIVCRTQLVPYSLVGVISHWSCPLTLSLLDAIPALLAGCAVLVKPSAIAPRFSLPLRASIESVPQLANVLEIMPGDGRTGSELIPLVDAACFSGSVRTGRLVAQAAAKRLIPAFLELGGKDPVIVTGSADLERATDVVLRASVLATGQACQSLERVYVHESIYGPFVQRLTEKAKTVNINYPDLHAGVVGPLIFDRQADTIASQLDEAVQKGAKILCGGLVEMHGGGYWVRPTVVVDVHHGMALMSEETFGPVMPVMPYHSVDEAVALANARSYGWSAAVIAGTLEEAEAIGRRLDAGAVSLNDGALTGLVQAAERNSVECSGLGGSRMGPAGLTRFVRRKALIRHSGAPATIGMFDEAHALLR